MRARSSNAYHVGTAQALGYGIIIQAVEIATRRVMGIAHS